MAYAVDPCNSYAEEKSVASPFPKAPFLMDCNYLLDKSVASMRSRLRLLDGRGQHIEASDFSATVNVRLPLSLLRYQTIWCMRKVRDWYRGILSRGLHNPLRGKPVPKVPDYVRICLSWVLLRDVHQWSDDFIILALRRTYGYLEDEMEGYANSCVQVKDDFEPEPSLPVDPVGQILREEAPPISNFWIPSPSWLNLCDF